MHAEHGHPQAQQLQQLGQISYHLGAVHSVWFSAGCPNQVSSATLERDGLLMLGPITHGSNCQHFSPGFEQKLPNFIAHRHVVEHVAHFNRVLNRHGFFLLNLLGNADNPRCAAGFRQKLGQKFLELVVHQLKHPAPGFGVLLNDLHDPFDFNFHCAARHINVKAEHTGPHTVNQAARWMLQGTKKLCF